MKDILLIVASLASMVVPVCLIILAIKDYFDRNKAEKQRLIEQVRETEARAKAEIQKNEQDRIRRDIKLALGYTNDQLVSNVMDYCPDKLMWTYSLDEMKSEIEKAKDDYDFDNVLKEKYLPIIGEEAYWQYHSDLLHLKSKIRLHKDLTPQEVIQQIDFYWQNDMYNINELELLSCVKPLNLYLARYNDFAFFNVDEVKNIANLIAERFNITITEDGMADVLRPSDHSSYRRSSFGISQIFARVLFHSEDVYSQISVLDERTFVDTINKYFFNEVCYDVKKFKVILPEIINHVKKESPIHRAYI